MGQALFKMWEPYRQSLIERHIFYVEQSKKRLLAQFEKIEAEAEEFKKDWLKKHNKFYDPDRHDPSEFYERAHEEGLGFYMMLDDMRNTTRLSVAAVMFHEWDKQFRDWTKKEFDHWYRSDEVQKKVWTLNHGDFFDLFEGFNWPVKSKPYFAALNKCRLVVNAFKHGNGGALEDIKKSHPELLTKLNDDVSFLPYTDYSDLTIDDSHIDEFSQAIIEFWKDVPEYIWSDGNFNLPQWFEKIMEKDLNNSQKPKAAQS